MQDSKMSVAPSAVLQRQSGIFGPPSVRANARRMKEFRELVPSGQHLVVFEAAARRISFTAAAAELGVSQPAVSRYVRQLERSLGVELFVRRHRSVELTDAGEVLHAAVVAGLSQIVQVARRLPQPSPRHVSVLVSASFAQHWMVSRLADFRALHSDTVELRIQVCDRHHELASDGATLGVRLGDGAWPGYEAALLASEVVFPVASPAFASRLAAPCDVASLAREPLIDDEELHLPTVSWAEFFDEFGVDFPAERSGLRVTDYVLAVQAAIAGQGLALGWAGLVDPLLEEGLLTAVGSKRWRTGRGFWLLWPASPPLSEKAAIVRDWMVEAASCAR